MRALRAVHGRFYLATLPLGVGLVGPGLIGGTFLDQIHQQMTVRTLTQAVCTAARFWACTQIKLTDNVVCALVSKEPTPEILDQYPYNLQTESAACSALDVPKLSRSMPLAGAPGQL